MINYCAQNVSFLLGIESWCVYSLCCCCCCSVQSVFCHSHLSRYDFPPPRPHPPQNFSSPFDLSDDDFLSQRHSKIVHDFSFIPSPPQPEPWLTHIHSEESIFKSLSPILIMCFSCMLVITHYSLSLVHTHSHCSSSKMKSQGINIIEPRMRERERETLTRGTFERAHHNRSSRKQAAAAAECDGNVIMDWKFDTKVLGKAWVKDVKMLRGELSHGGGEWVATTAAAAVAYDDVCSSRERERITMMRWGMAAICCCCWREKFDFIWHKYYARLQSYISLSFSRSLVRVCVCVILFHPSSVSLSISQQ